MKTWLVSIYVILMCAALLLIVAELDQLETQVTLLKNHVRILEDAVFDNDDEAEYPNYVSPKKRSNFVLTAYDPSYERLAQNISRRFHVSETFSLQVVATAYEVGSRTKTDPLVILAIIRVESSFNPVSEGSQGDIGLMQLHPKWQMDRIIEAGGLLAAWEPETNILIGARVLRRCLNQQRDLALALQCYNGNAIYPGKVINEYIYLKGITNGKTPRSREQRKNS